MRYYQFEKDSEQYTRHSTTTSCNCVEQGYVSKYRLVLLNWTRSCALCLPSSLGLQILGGFGGAVTLKASKRLRPYPGELLRSGLKQ
jgi:hypothetical protein